MSYESTLMAKGKITIPLVVRNALTLRAGDRFVFTVLSNGTVIMRAQNKSALRLTGTLQRKAGPPIAVEQLSR